MKSIVCILVLLLLCGSPALGAVSQGVFKDPRYPGKCTIRENMVLSPGQEVTDSEECRSISCGDNGVADFESCPVLEVHGCEEGDPIDKTLPYPNCCEPRVVCDEKQ